MLALLSQAGFAADPPIALPGHSLTVKIWTGRKCSGTGDVISADTPIQASHP
jgi:hypothetical protein